MDRSLRKWCDAHLSQSQTREVNTVAGALVSEAAISMAKIIEAAAFRRLTILRKIPMSAVSRLLDMDGVCCDQVTEIASTCPLDQSIPPEILGRLHEYLIGKQVATDVQPGQVLKRKRKVDGVFYTPRSIAHYIVRQTVGTQLIDRDPTQVRELKILDPAAGCGAFLVEAYRYLLEWHLNWYQQHEPHRWRNDIVRTEAGWKLSYRRAVSILENNLFGVDLDPGAICVARRILFLMCCEFSDVPNERKSGDLQLFGETLNLRCGNSLLGDSFGDRSSSQAKSLGGQFDWSHQFPTVASRGGFDVIIGNPPYRRELNFKQELDAILSSSLSRYRSPRMDLWYYFVHRGIALLRGGGQLSFITNAYWIQGRGAERLIAALRDEVHLDELFLLGSVPVFRGVTGQHVIFRLTKSGEDSPTIIKSVRPSLNRSVESIVGDSRSVTQFTKTRQQVFRDNRLDVGPPAEGFLEKMECHPRLGELGLVRQGIAENPATINRRTLDQFQESARENRWRREEGVFSLTATEVKQMSLSPSETGLLRPYHDLCDLARYWIADCPSRNLIYSTRTTCPAIDDYPGLKTHLARFRSILDARRETAEGQNGWWHLHWPRAESLWRSQKIIALQMSERPSFVPSFVATYVPFSVNVFVPGESTGEDLRYFAGLLNSRILWAWFVLHAKRRGVGLEINGHVLRHAPIRRIDFQNSEDVSLHDRLVDLSTQRMKLERTRRQATLSDIVLLQEKIRETESQIESVTAEAYRLDQPAMEMVDQLTRSQPAIE